MGSASSSLFGSFAGGDLFILNRDGMPMLLDSSFRPTLFDGRIPHCTLPFIGYRLVAIAFLHKQVVAITEWGRSKMTSVGFKLPPLWFCESNLPRCPLPSLEAASELYDDFCTSVVQSVEAEAALMGIDNGDTCGINVERSRYHTTPARPRKRWLRVRMCSVGLLASKAGESQCLREGVFFQAGVAQNNHDQRLCQTTTNAPLDTVVYGDWEGECTAVVSGHGFADRGIDTQPSAEQHQAMLAEVWQQYGDHGCAADATVPCIHGGWWPDGMEKECPPDAGGSNGCGGKNGLLHSCLDCGGRHATTMEEGGELEADAGQSDCVHCGLRLCHLRSCGGNPQDRWKTCHASMVSACWIVFFALTANTVTPMDSLLCQAPSTKCLPSCQRCVRTYERCGFPA